MKSDARQANGLFAEFEESEQVHLRMESKGFYIYSGDQLLGKINIKRM